VEFTLTAAALEVLADVDETPLLDKMPDDQRTRLRRELDALLSRFDLTQDERARLRGRLLDTRATGSAQAIRRYLDDHGGDGPAGRPTVVANPTRRVPPRRIIRRRPATPLPAT
jgi:hypothetical protein